MQASGAESEIGPMERADCVRPLPTGVQIHRLLASLVSPSACGDAPETEWLWGHIHEHRRCGELH